MPSDIAYCDFIRTLLNYDVFYSMWDEDFLPWALIGSAISSITGIPSSLSSYMRSAPNFNYSDLSELDGDSSTIMLIGLLMQAILLAYDRLILLLRCFS